MRLDAVEVKLNVAPGGVAGALALLGIHGDGTRRAIYFADDPLGNGGTLPLLDAGVVLRVRQAPDGKLDSTVKLRPCRRSQLTDEWLDSPKAGDDDAKLEADWVGERKVLAASLSAKQDPDSSPTFAPIERPSARCSRRGSRHSWTPAPTSGSTSTGSCCWDRSRPTAGSTWTSTGSRSWRSGGASAPSSTSSSCRSATSPSAAIGAAGASGWRGARSGHRCSTTGRRRRPGSSWRISRRPRTTPCGTDGIARPRPLNVTGCVRRAQASSIARR